MAAQTFVLTTTPTLIADGTKAAYIQEIIGSGTRFTHQILLQIHQQLLTAQSLRMIYQSRQGLSCGLGLQQQQTLLSLF